VYTGADREVCDARPVLNMKATRTLTMRTKILILCIACTVLALILQSVFFQYAASAIVYQQEQEASRKSLQNMQDELYDWIKSYENNLIKIYNRTDLIRDLSVRLPLNVLRSEYDRTAYDMALTDFNPAQNVNAIYLYTMDNELIANYRSANTPLYNFPADIFQEPGKYNTAAVSSYVHSDKRYMFVSSYYNSSRKKDLIRFVLRIYTNNVTERIGYIVCDVDSNSFARIIAKHLYSDRQLVWLQSTGDRPVITYGKASGMESSFFRESVSKIAGGAWVPGEGSRIRELVFFQISQRKYNLTAYSLTPQYLLKERQWILRRNMLIIALIVVAVAIVSATLMSRTLTRPLSRMIGGLEQIKNGQTNLRLSGFKADEIGALGNTINEMLDRIQELIAEEYKVTLLLKQAEYKALQAQVNPHFLYNSLDTMSSIAASQQCFTVSSLSRALSNMFRYSIDLKEPLSAIQEEILHIKNYMHVMNVRTRNSVDLQIRIEETLLDEKVPRLSLQPLVENSIIHGLTNKHGPKTIVIDGSLKNGSVMLSVSDNGVGMDAEHINGELRCQPSDTLDRSSSVGLANIHARARLLFGEEYGVTVQSSLGKGSTVTLVVPRAQGGAGGS
jgi:sensor histidine kinase YesM